MKISGKQVHRRDTVNRRAVRILLECILLMDFLELMLICGGGDGRNYLGVGSAKYFWGCWVTKNCWDRMQFF